MVNQKKKKLSRFDDLWTDFLIHGYYTRTQSIGMLEHNRKTVRGHKMKKKNGDEEKK